MYIYAAATDIAALAGDEALKHAVDRIWENTVSNKTYITGAIGATAEGEAFGIDFELPNDKAYAETCANLATCFWNHRMFLLHGDAKYIDALELALYNSAISGVALDGKTFFYPNPLASTGKYTRSKWFDCACCPTNICRFIPSIPGYAYAIRDDTLYVNLFATGLAEVELAGGKVRAEQETGYPWDGRVTIRLLPKVDGQQIALKVRIPGWARGDAFVSDLYRFADEVDEKWELSVNGEPVASPVENGFVTIDRKWTADDSVTLNLPMPVRRVVANEKVEADRGRVALMRGPIVYCIESTDMPGRVPINELSLSDAAKLSSEFRKDHLGGVQLIRGAVRRQKIVEEERIDPTTGKSTPKPLPVMQEFEFSAVPYYAWANRGPSEMAVWIKRLPKPDARKQ
jgi:DUF1680 family protein